jgi:hypothetical protein
MKNRGFRIAVIASLLMLVFSPLIPGPRAEPAEGACSNRTVRGDYGLTIEAQAGPQFALRGVGMAQFDGAGHFTQVQHVVVNGTPPAQQWSSGGTGTYSVNPDCTATAVFNFADGSPPGRDSFVVVRQGAELHLVVDNAPGAPSPGLYVIVTAIRRDEP